MSNRREPQRSGAVLELMLTLLAVIAGSVAATGSFLGASYERDRVELERRPAVLLSCEPEFRALDTAERTKPPTNTVLLTAKGARWIHIVSDGRGDVPQPFARCALTSYGRLPVFNLRVAMKLQLLAGRRNEAKTTDSFFDVPGLSPSVPYRFGVINGADTRMRFRFDDKLTLTPVDSGMPTVETLFLDQGVLNLQQRFIEADTPLSALDETGPSQGTAMVRITNFSYAPAELHVRSNQTVTFANDDAEAHTITGSSGSFDSGAIDPQGQWRHAFSRPGVYAYMCAFHPYMHGRIVVSR